MNRDKKIKEMHSQCVEKLKNREVLSSKESDYWETRMNCILDIEDESFEVEGINPFERMFR